MKSPSITVAKFSDILEEKDQAQLNATLDEITAAAERDLPDLMAAIEKDQVQLNATIDEITAAAERDLPDLMAVTVGLLPSCLS